jgi:protein-tyrosine phosphatase
MMKKILFVCLGNICRSPLAEGVFLKIAYDKGLATKYTADSCGTAAYHIGEKPDSRAIKTAKQYGIDLNHVGRQIKPKDLDDFTLILVMDRENLHNTLKLSSPTNKHKIKLLRDYEPFSFNDAEVPDPYYGGQSGFEEVYEIAYRCCENLITQLEKT